MKYTSSQLGLIHTGCLCEQTQFFQASDFIEAGDTCCERATPLGLSGDATHDALSSVSQSSSRNLGHWADTDSCKSGRGSRPHELREIQLRPVSDRGTSPSTA